MEYRARQSGFTFWAVILFVLISGIAITILSFDQSEFEPLLLGIAMVVGSISVVVKGRKVYFEIRDELMRVQDRTINRENVVSARPFAKGSAVYPNAVLIQLKDDGQQMEVSFGTRWALRRHLPVLKDWLQGKYEEQTVFVPSQD